VARDDQPLETPIDEEFRVGVIGIAYLADRKLVEIDLQAIADSQSPEEDELLMEISESQDILRVCISLGYSESFVKRAMAVLGAGRAPCPFCGAPIDPNGHLCPRANGYRR
jgi:uncharacterized repeat protein (TIGR03847 family)